MSLTPRIFSSRVIVVPLVALVASGCTTVGPDYAPPQPVVGDGWSAAAAPEPLTAEELGSWWRRFEDPTLDRLVESALEQNLGLRQAAARIAEARAIRDRTAGRALPRADAGASVTERRQSENGSLPVGRIPGLERDQTLVDLGVDASWEIDLFGRTRRAVEAADARIDAAREDQRGVQMAVVAEVVRTYLALRGGQGRLAAVEDSLGAARRTADLVQTRLDAGDAARIDLYRARADVHALEARLPELRAELTALALSLGPLTGELPESRLDLLDAPAGELVLAPFPVGERAELLRRRPDVAAAERRLAAAGADIGVAVAELYPRLSIGARGGFQALDGTNLLEASSATWSLVPSISWRLFDGGRVRAEIRLAEARAEATALAWEETVLAALADAERALVRYRGGLDALEALDAAVAEAGRTRDLEDLRYRSGESSLFSLLESERRLDELRAELEGTRVEASADLVALVKALGGGWSEASISEPAAESPLAP